VEKLIVDNATKLKRRLDKVEELLVSLEHRKTEKCPRLETDSRARADPSLT